MLNPPSSHARPKRLEKPFRKPRKSHSRRLYLTHHHKTHYNIPPPNAPLKPQHPLHNPRLPRRHSPLHNPQCPNPIRQHPVPPPSLHRRNILYRNCRHQYPPLPLPHPRPNIPYPHQLRHAPTDHRPLPRPHKCVFDVHGLSRHRTSSHYIPLATRYVSLLSSLLLSLPLPNFPDTFKIPILATDMNHTYTQASPSSQPASAPASPRSR